MKLKENSALKVIVGLGDTGISCARFLAKQNMPFAITDNRKNPPQLKTFLQEFPKVEVVCGEFSEKLLNAACEIVMSPGVSLREPAIAKQVANKKSIIGDIELFARYVKKPVSSITGSNGKTTVTTLLGLMLTESGKKVSVCGNIGKPVLDQLSSSQSDYYVIELSSFQLETTYSLNPITATVLNVSPDHMDRYDQYSDYIHAKQRIYTHCHFPVINRDQPLIWEDLKLPSHTVAFSVTQQKGADFTLSSRNKTTYLTFQNQPLIAVDELKLNAEHHIQNALAALAMGHAMDISLENMFTVLRHFAGLPHRCQWVRKYNGVDWYNDSKGTNVGATEAAILSLGKQAKGKLILIAGGQGKNADFSSLQQSVQHYVEHVILIGEDAPLLEKALKKVTHISHATSMEAAIMLATKLAKPNDFVVLSPACASFDMFNNYEHRGEVFMNIVNTL